MAETLCLDGDATFDTISCSSVTHSSATGDEIIEFLKVSGNQLIFLTSIVATQSDFKDWRLGEAWACNAEGYQRTGNPLAALRSLGMCFLRWENGIENRLVLRAGYRLAARIFRDIGLYEFALDMIELEQKLLPQIENSHGYLLELQQLELSVQAKQIASDSTSETLIQLLSRLSGLLNESAEIERTPVLALMAHLIVLLKFRGVAIDTNIETKYMVEVQQLHSPFRAQLELLSIVKPTIRDLQNVLANTADASYISDLSHQLEMCQILAKRAIRAANQQSDPELFLLASSIISQPALSLRIVQKTEKDGFYSPAKVMQWFNSLTEGTINLQKVADAKSIMDSVISINRLSIKQMVQATLTQLQSTILRDEAVILLASDFEHQLYRLVILHEGVIGPEPLNENLWSSTAYQEWRKHYPKGYGKCKLGSPYDDESISNEEVKQSINSLSIGDLPPSKRMTLIPEGAFFGFPYSLMAIDDHYVGERVELATAPSVPWLIFMRSNIWSGSLARKFWLGSPSSQDLSLGYLCDYLYDSLENYHFECIESERPAGIDGAQIVIIASHGGTGAFDYFTNLTDEIHYYAAEEFARNFAGCGCVVLFVCHAGRSDESISSSETVGLVSELLRVGVRAVVAPAWSLHVYIPPIWLPTFLRHLTDGRSVGESVYLASEQVRERFNDLCAWSALQLYGDQTFRLSDRRTNTDPI